METLDQNLNKQQAVRRLVTIFATRWIFSAKCLPPSITAQEIIRIKQRIVKTISLEDDHKCGYWLDLAGREVGVHNGMNPFWK